MEYALSLGGEGFVLTTCPLHHFTSLCRLARSSSSFLGVGLPTEKNILICPNQLAREDSDFPALLM